MTNANVVADVLFSAIEELNLGRPPGAQLVKSLDTALFGKDGQLDSLGLVGLIVMTEQKLEETLGVSLVLADDRAMSQKRSPFRTVGSLVEYVVGLLNETGQP